jgi:hypothetical protein
MNICSCGGKLPIPPVEAANGGLLWRPLRGGIAGAVLPAAAAAASAGGEHGGHGLLHRGGASGYRLGHGALYSPTTSGFS